MAMWANGAEAVPIDAGSSRSPRDFGEVRPLPRLRPEAPSLPGELLPEPLSAWLCDIGVRLQVSLEMVAVPAVVALSSVVGRRVGMHPKAQDDWLVVPNLWGAIIASPGRLKSPALAETVGPLRKLERQARTEEANRQDHIGAHLENLKAQELALKDQLRKLHRNAEASDDAGLEARLVEVRKAIRISEEGLPGRRFLLNDPTVEKLGELLRSNPQGLLLERDELAGWLKSLERSDRAGDREFFLEAWNGTNAFTVDRIGRGRVDMPALCVSILGGIQPAKLKRYVAEALADGYAADGLLQRFQLLVWPEDERGWKLVDRQPDQAGAQRATEVFHRLANLPMPGDTGPAATYRFSGPAQNLFYDWLTQLETRLRSGELSEQAAFQGHLAKYRSLMPSLALVFHLIEAEGDGAGDPVTVRAAQLASAWCEFLELHARKVYGCESRPGLASAHALAKKIKAGDIHDGMALRSIYQPGWSGLDTVEKVRQGVEVLEENGWGRLAKRETGGRPTEVLELNERLGESSHERL